MFLQYIKLIIDEFLKITFFSLHDVYKKIIEMNMIGVNIESRNIDGILRKIYTKDYI